MTTRLYINDVELDISKNVVFPLTYSISDVKSPEKRKRNSSKSIVLPGTIVNNKFFQSAYDLTISDVRGDSLGFDFDPTIRYNARVVRNGSEIFRGTANLTKVSQKAKINSFHILLYSEITNLFQSLGDTLISELGWSEYDHDLTIANIQASWVAATGSGYWYPLIDFGLSQDLLSYKTNELKPYVYVSEIVEKCFELAGITMTSAFFDSTRIKKIAFGFGGGEQVVLTSAQIADRQANYTGDGSTTYQFNHSYIGYSTNETSWGPASFVIPFSDNSVVTMTQVTDTNGQFDEPTGELVVYNSGSYRLNVSGGFPITYTLPGTPGTPNIEITVTMRVFKNGAYVASEQHSIVATAGGTTNLTFNLLHEMDLDAGDIVTSDLHVYTYALSSGGPYPIQYGLTVDLNNTLDFNFTGLNVALIDGDEVQLSRFLPRMKATDFMKDIITAFNLYMSDPDTDGDVLFEPIDDYYFETNDVDQWSEKLDRSEIIDISPAANIQGKVYAFKWALDRDYYKQLYFDTYGTDYGDYDYNVPSTFKTGEKKYQLKIAQSVPVQIENTNIIIPRIIKLNEANQVAGPHKGKPRIFFNNGLIASDNWNLVNSDTMAATVNSSYPQAHHLDSVASPTFDLNFGVPQYVYYTATQYTTRNLFSEYNAQFIRELTGRDSKMVNALFRLNEKDLYNNFMRRLCNIDGVIYRKNLVKDFRATSNDVTQVELVKIVTGNSRKVYTIGVPKFGPLPDYNPIGGGVPITEDGSITTYKQTYPVDTSGGDVTITMDSETIRPGFRFNVKKVNSGGGKIILNPISSGATGISYIDGMPVVYITGYNDNLDIELIDKENFKII